MFCTYTLNVLHENKKWQTMPPVKTFVCRKRLLEPQFELKREVEGTRPPLLLLLVSPLQTPKRAVNDEAEVVASAVAFVVVAMADHSPWQGDNCCCYLRSRTERH
ncbi:hypothetical protein GQX74_008968 [Glossina fuscipes]|nr:hypothetical protein GQX74_008968 [Glossina fuscipes]